jgi:putative addiction module CopG family antidote
MNYTVNISIPKPLADMAHEQVKKGYYSTLSEVVRQALRKLLIEDQVPTFKMSKKAEKRAEKAYQEYLDGKAIRLKSLNDLDTL